MQTLQLADGRKIDRLGLGTWRMGEEAGQAEAEIAALRSGIEAGASLIDTAEMYANGQSERIVAQAIKPYKREDLFLVSKILPSNANEASLEKALDASLERLDTDYLDLYLLHWQSATPIQETIDLFEEMKAKGKIKGWGVSNFDLEPLKAVSQARNGDQCQTNQVLYHIGSRGVEVVLKDYMADQQMPLMAYCPLAGQDPSIRASILTHPIVEEMAADYHLKPAQLILAWLLQDDLTIAIPKSSSIQHTKENMAVQDVKLEETDLSCLNQTFPRPDSRQPLEIR